MSSSSEVIDLERRAMAGGVSLLVCCGAAKRIQPNTDLMFSVHINTQSPTITIWQQAFRMK